MRPREEYEVLANNLDSECRDYLNSSGEAGWPEPKHLGSILKPESFPLDDLPETLGRAVSEAQAFTQAPIGMVATSAISAISMSAQGLYNIERAEGLVGPIAIYTLVVAPSGERKTTCDECFVKPVRDWQAKKEKESQLILKKFEAENQAWSAQCEGVQAAIKDGAKKGELKESLRQRLAELHEQKPSRPRVPRLIYSDITPEQLGYQLANFWPSAAISSSEGGAVFGSHGMTGDNVMRTMARLNDIWSGAEIHSDRRTSESWVVHGARLSVGLQIQAPVLRAFLNRTAGLARGSGFFSRFLFSYPESTQGSRFFKDPPKSWPGLTAYHERILQLLEMPLTISREGSLVPNRLFLSPEAKLTWIAYHDAVERQLVIGGEYGEIRDVASKAAENAARIAALLHVFEGGGDDPVGVESMRSGCKLANWYLREAKRFFTEFDLPQELSDAIRVIDWAVKYAHEHGVRDISTRDLQRLGPLRSKDRLGPALNELNRFDHIRIRDEDRRRWIEINPALFGLGGYG